MSCPGAVDGAGRRGCAMRGAAVTQAEHEAVEALIGIDPDHVPEDGPPPISTSGFGIASVCSRRRAPPPAQRITTSSSGRPAGYAPPGDARLRSAATVPAAGGTAPHRSRRLVRPSTVTAIRPWRPTPRGYAHRDAMNAQGARRRRPGNLRLPAQHRARGGALRGASGPVRPASRSPVRPRQAKRLRSAVGTAYYLAKASSRPCTITIFSVAGSSTSAATVSSR
jgi:hypothetical protein